MTGWDGFGERLAEQLTLLGPESVLIIREGGGTGRYAQFLQSDEGVEAELVGDHGLDPALRAGEEGSRLIVEAGWKPPRTPSTATTGGPNCPGRRLRARIESWRG